MYREIVTNEIENKYKYAICPLIPVFQHFLMQGIPVDQVKEKADAEKLKRCRVIKEAEQRRKKEDD